MQTRRGSLDKVFMAMTCVVLGLIALLGGDLFLLFFTPVVVYVIWSGNRKVNELQRRVAELEDSKPRPLGQEVAKPDDAPGEA